MKIKRQITVFAKCILLMHLLLLQENEIKYLLTALIRTTFFQLARYLIHTFCFYLPNNLFDFI